MPTDVQQSNSLIEENITAAAEGIPDKIRLFFQGFLDGPLIVPERYQERALSHSPKYPNDFVNILGIQDNERVIVPAFSSNERLREWSGTEFVCKKLSGNQLLKLIPPDWWICVNPGSEIEKDISPWEIEQLKGGSAFIEEIINEIETTEPQKDLKLSEIKEEELPAMRNELIKVAQAFTEIQALYIMKEAPAPESETPLDTILIGVEAAVKEPLKLQSIKDDLRSAAARHLMGGAEIRTTIAPPESNLTLGAFRLFKPIYQKKPSKFSVDSSIKRIFKIFKAT